jgi:hypothetical protein
MKNAYTDAVNVYLSKFCHPWMLKLQEIFKAQITILQVRMESIVKCKKLCQLETAKTYVFH